VEPPGEVGGCLLTPVLASIPFANLQSGDRHPDLRPPLGAALSSGEPTLEENESPLPSWARPRGAEHLAGGQGRADRDAAVDAYDLPGLRAQDRSRDHCEGDMPPTRPVTGHPVGLGRWDSAAPPEPHPASFRNP